MIIMKLGVVMVTSPLRAKKPNVTRLVRSVLKQLKDSEIEIVSLQTFALDVKGANKLVKQVLSAEVDALAYIIASGGAERMVLESARNVTLPIFLLANSSDNSFAATCEVLPKLKSMGKRVKPIFNGKIGEVITREMRQIVEIDKVIQRLHQTRLGLLGGLSPWLVSGCTDFKLIKDKIGPQIVPVDLSELVEIIKEIPNSRANEISREFLSSVSKMVEPTERDLTQAVKIYLGLKNLVAKYQLDALSIKCFDLIPALDNTGCFAVSRMIDEGVIAGCEGDIDTTLTMLVLHYLTNEPVWLANTCSIDQVENTLTFAHCTIATKLLEDASKVTLRSHFESGKGVSIQGAPKLGQKVTIARLGGLKMDRMVIATGTIHQSDMGGEHMCRTQVEVRLDGKVETFTDNLLGNHVAISRGDISSKLRGFCDLLAINTIPV
jgi:L-fucose isomerase-like protein